MADLHVVILAAGKGTRMKSELPKDLHRVGGIQMIEHVIGAARTLSPRTITVVIGHQGETLETALSQHTGLQFVVQEPQQGTGHALMMTEPVLGHATGTVALLYGDVPLLSA